MALNGFLQIAVFFATVFLLARPLGGYMTRVFTGQRVWLSRILLPVEKAFYRLAGVDPEEEQHWAGYAVDMLLLNAAGFVLLYGMQRLQAYLPFNPQQLDSVPPLVAFNTAVSFVTNTNWQAYAGETTISYFVQMAGLTVQNFVSAGTGIALAIALIRGFARHSLHTIGNFRADLTRAVLYVLLPVSVVAALVFVALGVPQNLGGYVEATTLEGARQTIAQGPVASQIAIKMLGTNGGGFFNANSAHPYENPSAISNFIQMILMICIGAALTNVFGRMLGNPMQGWALFGVMAILAVAGAVTLYTAESGGNPNLATLGIDQAASHLQAGGNMEGKEVRFGMAGSALFSSLTTDASSGAVNTMHDSLTPLGGLVTMLNIQLGEIIFGGVGSGLYGMLLFAIVAMFIAGLMVGRTPEYVGKKLEVREIKMTMLALLALPFANLGFTALALSTSAGLAGIGNAGPHGYSEILYAFTSASGNNGSAFAGLNANSTFYNLTTALAMLIGRFGVIVPMLAVAGSLAGKKKVAPSPGTFPTDNGLFVGLLTGIILIVGGLVFFPALALGPIVEHIAMNSGTLF
ncbi:MAG: potassium-transporting ATPase subunit KdpA [Bdellovibrionales bacterium]